MNIIVVLNSVSEIQVNHLYVSNKDVATGTKISVDPVSVIFTNIIKSIIHFPFGLSCQEI